MFLVAADRKQARVCLRYVKGLLASSTLLGEMVVKEREDGVELLGHVQIEVATCSSRTIRGYTLAAAICDEAAFWQDENTVEPDREVLQALRPALATIPGSLLLCASSPYARKGMLWDAYQRHFARDGDPVLVVQAPTLRMNPNVPASVIEEARLADPQSAAAEYDAQFRSDVETFVSRDVIDRCTPDKGVTERAPRAGVQYFAFVDPSGGTHDQMVLAIAHAETDGTAVLDCTVTRKPPFSPEQVVADFAVWLKRYRCASVTGDAFGGEWPRERFQKAGINYNVSRKKKRELYVDLIPLLNSTRVSLTDYAPLHAELCGLERRVQRGGHEVIDHPINGRDDVANAAAGALTLAAASTGGLSRAMFSACPIVIGGAQAVRPDLQTPPTGEGGGGGIQLSDMPRGLMGDDRFSDGVFVPR